MRFRRWAASFGAAVLAGALTGCNPPQPWHSELLSSNAAGTDSGNAESSAVAFSPDGTKVAFESAAADLVPTGSNGFGDVYVRDLTTGTTTLVSASISGTGGNEKSFDPVFSPDSTKIAFTSRASDLVAGDGNWSSDVFLHDLASGSTTRVSLNAAGTDGASSDSEAPAFSPDGTKIAFTTWGTDLGVADANGTLDIFVRDLTAGTTTLVSADPTGTHTVDGGFSINPTFSPTGNAVLFNSIAGGFGPTDTNDTFDVYLRDLTAGTTTLVSVNASGTDSGAGVSRVFGVRHLLNFSADGSQVVFDSQAQDLVADNPVPRYEDVFVRDLATGTTSRVSPADDQAYGGTVWGLGFSPDGLKVAFTSRGELVPGATGGWWNVFVRDLGTGEVTLVSVNAAGTGGGDGDAYQAYFDPTGTKVAFESRAGNLGFDGEKADSFDPDVYVRDLVTDTTTLVSGRPEGGRSNGRSFGPQFRPSSNQIGFTSTSTDLGVTDTNGVADVFLATYTAADLDLTLSASPDPVSSGANLTYHFVVDNHGPDTAAAVAGSLRLPAGTTFVGATGGCAPDSANDHVVVCSFADLGSGQDLEAAITVHVVAGSGTTLEAVGTVTSGTADLAAGNESRAIRTMVD